MIVVLDLSASSQPMYLPKLAEYLRDRRYDFVVVSEKDQLVGINPKHIDAVVLSGSKLYVSDLQNSPRHRELLKAIPKTCKVIGICFGAQYLYTVLGGQLERLPRFVCSQRVLKDTGCGLFTDKKVQFCLYETFKMPYVKTIVPLASARIAGYDRLCAFRAKDVPWFGLLFHPEAQKMTWTILDKVLSDR